MNPDSKPLGVIEPIRFLPFDIGCEIDDSIKQKIQIELNQNFQPIAENGNVVRLLKTNSEYFLFGYHVSETIDLYIYRYGIAVFVIRGEIYSITDVNYATDYCANRKDKHASYLTSENKNTSILKEIAARLRNIVQAVCFNLRRSAREDWEFGGFSYVMTISIITKTDGNLVYEKMDDIDKANLQIMLEPSLANKEDSLIFSCYKESVDDICQIDLKNLNPPKNFLNSANRFIYISWAAVLFYTKEPDKSIEQMLTALEIDLQAMWMNVYCMYDNLVKGTTERKMKVSKLRQKLFSFQKLLNEFQQLSDSSLPAYVLRIREELIRTSGIEKYVQNFKEEMEFLIAKTESITAEKQKKYSWLNEFLLFLIAFIQIAPMLYDALVHGLPDLQLLPVIVMILIIVIAAVILIKKN